MTESSLLQEIGLFGYDEIEDVIIASLVTGDPLLLVGTHGTAKTMLCRNLSRALGMAFIAYDASKALFEDVLGFPNPYSMENGVIDYISTPISIQGKEFVLVDELSRANYQLQGKWLEIIRSRRIMGQEIRSLRYIFGAMNPPSYLGARSLDPALSGRFAFIVWVPGFADLDPEAKKAVLANLSEDDAVAMKATDQDYPSKPSRIPKVVQNSRSLYSEIESKLDGKIGDFILALERNLSSHNYTIDGRRAGMIRRSLIAILSVKATKGVDVDSQLFHICRESVPHLLPYSVELEDFRNESLTIVLEDALQEIFGNSANKDINLWNNLCINNLIGLIEKETVLERKISLIKRLYSMPVCDDNIDRLFEFHNEYFCDIGAGLFYSIFSESGLMPEVSSIKTLTDSQVCGIRLAPKLFNTNSYLKSKAGYKSDIASIQEVLDKGR